MIFDFLLPDTNENNYSLGTKDGIDPKPGPNFEFVHCLKVYKKSYKIGPWKDPGGALYVPQIFDFLEPDPNEKKYSFRTKGGIEALNLSLSIV